MYLVIILGPIFTLFLSCFFFNKFPQRFMFGLFFTSLIISLICSVFIVYEVVYLNSFCLIEITTWFKLGLLNVHWSFYFDKLSTLLLFLIIFISILVHFFALDYLNEDPHLPRFLMLLSLFTIFMEILVTSGNIVQLFLGWEGVGLTSYLLIGYYNHKASANKAAIKAFVVNRVGDFGGARLDVPRRRSA